MSTKAAETEGLLTFAHKLLEDHLEQLKSISSLEKNFYEQGRLLHAASDQAVKFDSMVRNVSQRRVSRETQFEMLQTYSRFVVLFDRAGGEHIPKTHLMFHCILEAGVRGNPKFYHTYRDEWLNGVIAKIARSCHRTNWSFNVFKKISISKQIRS